MKNPQLTFFCELDALALERLFADPSVIDDLVHWILACRSESST